MPRGVLSTTRKSPAKFNLRNLASPGSGIVAIKLLRLTLTLLSRFRSSGVTWIHLSAASCRWTLDEGERMGGRMTVCLLRGERSQRGSNSVTCTKGGRVTVAVGTGVEMIEHEKEASRGAVSSRRVDAHCSRDAARSLGVATTTTNTTTTATTPTSACATSGRWSRDVLQMRKRPDESSTLLPRLN